MDMKLEVVVLPVTDADRAKQFYASLGWREDAAFVFTEDFRVLQFTPPGSQASISFGTGVTPAGAESAGSLLLGVDERHGTTAGAVAIAWTRQNPAVDGAIVGFRRPDQVDPLVFAANLELTAEDLVEIG